MTDFEELLVSIGPDRTFNEMARRIDEALNLLPYAHAVLATWGEFVETMEAFHCFVENVALRLNPPRDVYPQEDWGHCATILIQLYGPNGEKAAMDMARTGKEGGLYAVMRAVGRRMGEEYAQAEIRVRVSLFWNALTADEQHAAASEYVERWGRLLPPELTEVSAARLRDNFPAVLRAHPRILNEMRGNRGFGGPSR